MKIGIVNDVPMAVEVLQRRVDVVEEKEEAKRADLEGGDRQSLEEEMRAGPRQGRLQLSIAAMVQYPTPCAEDDAAENFDESAAGEDDDEP